MSFKKFNFVDEKKLDKSYDYSDSCRGWLTKTGDKLNKLYNEGKEWAKEHPVETGKFIFEGAKFGYQFWQTNKHSKNSEFEKQKAEERYKAAMAKDNERYEFSKKMSEKHNQREENREKREQERFIREKAQYERAFKKLRLEEQSEQADLYLKRGLELSCEEGRYLEAADNFKHAIIELEKNIDFIQKAKGRLSFIKLCFLQVQSLFHAGKYEQALLVLDKSLKVNEIDSNILALKGKSLLKLQRKSEAIEFFKKSLKNNSNQPDVLAYQAFCAEDYLEIIRLLQPLKEEYAKKKEILDIDLLEILGTAYVRSTNRNIKDYSLALENFTTVINCISKDDYHLQNRRHKLIILCGELFHSFSKVIAAQNNDEKLLKIIRKFDLNFLANVKSNEHEWHISDFSREAFYIAKDLSGNQLKFEIPQSKANSNNSELFLDISSKEIFEKFKSLSSKDKYKELLLPIFLKQLFYDKNNLLIKTFDKYKILKEYQVLKDKLQRSRESKDKSGKNASPYYALFTEPYFCKLNNSQNNTYFREEIVPGHNRGDCGFETLGITRKTLVETLLKTINMPDNRKYLAGEISNTIRYAYVIGSNHYLLTSRCRNLFKTQDFYEQELTKLKSNVIDEYGPRYEKNYDSVKTRLKFEDVINNLKREDKFEDVERISKNVRYFNNKITQISNELSQYCRSIEVVREYIKGYLRNYYPSVEINSLGVKNKKSKHSWLGCKSMLLYAKQQSITLHILCKTHTQNLIYHKDYSYVSSNPTADVIYASYNNGSAFNRLIITNGPNHNNSSKQTKLKDVEDEIETELKNFCLKDDVFKAFIESYSNNISDLMNLDINGSAAFLRMYAEIYNVNIRVWQRKYGSSNVLFLTNNLESLTKKPNKTYDFINADMFCFLNNDGLVPLIDVSTKKQPRESKNKDGNLKKSKNKVDSNSILTQYVRELNSAAFKCFKLIFDYNPYDITCLINLANNYGYPYAQSCLCQCYIYGLSVLQDYNAAFKLAKTAAAQSNIEGCVWLGVLYELGLGVEKNYKTAFELYNMALQYAGWRLKTEQTSSVKLEKISNSDLNYSDIESALKALCNIGRMYLCGNGVDKNQQYAYKIFVEAKSQGCRNALINQAICLLGGIGVKQDKDKAEKILDGIKNYKNPRNRVAKDFSKWLLEKLNSGQIEDSNLNVYREQLLDAMKYNMGLSFYVNENDFSSYKLIVNAFKNTLGALDNDSLKGVSKEIFDKLINDNDFIKEIQKSSENISDEAMNDIIDKLKSSTEKYFIIDTITAFGKAKLLKRKFMVELFNIICQEFITHRDIYHLFKEMNESNILNGKSFYQLTGLFKKLRLNQRYLYTIIICLCSRRIMNNTKFAKIATFVECDSKYKFENLSNLASTIYRLDDGNALSTYSFNMLFNTDGTLNNDIVTICETIPRNLLGNNFSELIKQPKKVVNLYNLLSSVTKCYYVNIKDLIIEETVDLILKTENLNFEVIRNKLYQHESCCLTAQVVCDVLRSNGTEISVSSPEIALQKTALNTTDNSRVIKEYFAINNMYSRNMVQIIGFLNHHGLLNQTNFSMIFPDGNKVRAATEFRNINLEFYYWQEGKGWNNESIRMSNEELHEILDRRVYDGKDRDPTIKTCTIL